MWKIIKSRLSLKITDFAFTDIVSHKPVYHAVDCFGDRWLVESASPFTFRVKSKGVRP